MSELGEVVSVPKPVVEKEEKGDLKVTVQGVCDDQPIADAEVTINKKTQKTDEHGVSEFLDLSIGAISVKVKSHMKEMDYSTFVIHYPKVLRSHSAKTSGSDIAEIKVGKNESIKIELEVLRIVGEIVFHRRQIDRNSEDKYGHWWTVVDENTSFGWWPKYPVGSPKNRLTAPPKLPETLPSDASKLQTVQHMFKTAVYNVKTKMYDMKESAPGQTIRGVEGELNAKYFGGIVNEEKNIYGDPHALDGDSGDEQYQPVRSDCFALNEIKECAVDFALSYSGGWSWFLEEGNHCHTFQKKMIKQCQLEKVKVLK